MDTRVFIDKCLLVNTYTEELPTDQVAVRHSAFTKYIECQALWNMLC